MLELYYITLAYQRGEITLEQWRAQARQWAKSTLAQKISKSGKDKVA